MADIKQAARWMQDGEIVARARYEHRERLMLDDSGGIVDFYGDSPGLIVADILADDWEIVQ